MLLMRLPVVLLCAACLAGCAGRKPARLPQVGPSPGTVGTAPVSTSNRGPIITPGRATTGRVAAVNTAGRFVVLTFPLGTMPPLEKRLNVYRGGLKVGEVKVTGPQLDINIDADMVAGECQVGDEVREE